MSVTINDINLVRFYLLNMNACRDKFSESFGISDYCVS